MVRYRAWSGLKPLMLAAGMLLAACDGESPAPGPSPAPTATPTPAPAPVTVNSSFAAGLDGWTAAYADYAPGQEASIGFVSGHERLPAPMQAQFGVFLASDNRPDDLFMYLWRPVTGLAPNRRYRIEVAVAFATNAPPGCIGAGGSPGESIFIKAGASPRAPAGVTVDGKIVPNFSHGDQSESGTDAVAIGTFTQTAPAGSCLDGQYTRKELATAGSGPLVTSDAEGRLWLVVGTDSGYEGYTKAYFLEVAAVLTPA